jgi:hypothetical protein
MYEVMGLATPQKVVVGYVDHKWRYMHGFGDSGSQWIGEFETPRAALSAVAAALGAEADDVPTIQPHDGVARQDDDGAWRVYEVDHEGVEILREGPFASKDGALERLKVLVPIEQGDQWVVDAFGVAYTLN